MTCREHDLSSALTSFGRISAGLKERQDANLFHRLTDEGEGQDLEAPDQWTLEEFIDEQIDLVSNDPDISAKRRISILKRLEEAKNNLGTPKAKPVSAPMYYALQRFVGRARLARIAFDRYLDDTARELGITRIEAGTLFDSYQQEAIQKGPTCTAGEEWAHAFQQTSAAENLPLDRGSLYAYQKIEEARATKRALQPLKKAVALEPVEDEAISAIGYSAESQYMEIEFHSRPGKPYSYRIDPGSYNEFRSAAALEAYYRAHIRGNPDYMFQDASEWKAFQQQRKCATCGRFYSGNACTCPVRGSKEERNRTVRRARAGLLGTSEELPDDIVRLPAPARWRYFDNESDGSKNTTKTVGLTDLQTTAKTGETAMAPVSGTSLDNGQEYHQHGSIYAQYLGYGQGFFLGAVTDPGDSEDRQLRCDCPEYKTNYTCKHVRALVADLANRLNATSVKNPDTVPRDRATSPDDLAPERFTSNVAWDTEESSWLESEEDFYDAYLDARTRFRHDLAPGDYRTENVTAGMASRETGRPFGIELEFSLPDKMTDEERAAAKAGIAKALYRRELAGSLRFEDKEDREGAEYSDQHKGGWILMNDNTCDGEIVSPLMWDEPDTWQNINTVCEVIKKYGGTATPKTGFHVHVSTSDFKEATAATRLIEHFNANEDIMLRLATNPHDGTHRGTIHCVRNTTPAMGTVPIGEVALHQLATGPADQRDTAINMLSMRGDVADNIEYRIYDGSLDPFVIQNQINLSLALTQDAMRDTTTAPDLTSGIVGSNADHNENKRISDKESRPFRAMLDRLFWRDEDKAAMTALFAVNKWQQADA